MKEIILKNKLLVSILFILIIGSIFFCKPSFCADSVSLQNWVEENENELATVFKGYDYFLYNNHWLNYVAIYYTNAPNNKFYFSYRDSRSTLINSSSDLGTNYFAVCILNPNNDNNFEVPSSIIDVVSTGATLVGRDNCAVNNWSSYKSNILYTNCNLYYNNELLDIEQNFFQKTPLTEIPETIPATVEIPKLETVQQIPETMATTLKMIIPVGLVVLSMVLVIYLVRRVIYQSL